MKIRNPFLIRFLAFLLSWVLRVWTASLASRYRCLGPDLFPNRPDLKGRYIFTFWHENLFLLAGYCGYSKVKVLISRHADGELIARVCRHMGFGTIRGSATRGGIEALRQMICASKNCHLGVVPDGPRGPRRHLQAGLIYLGSRTGLPIVPVGIGYHGPWRARSWDRFALPRPGTRACAVIGEPILIPSQLNKEQLEEQRHKVEKAMHHVNDLAERWAETGKWPPEMPNQACRPKGLGPMLPGVHAA